jgi:signal transduction histidine kinase
MIRTIKQRIYLMGLLPLAALAVALVAFNGLYQIDEANRELRSSQEVTANLLNSAAAEALTVGNTLNFEQLVNAAIKTSPNLLCVRLSDARYQLVSEIGDCAQSPARFAHFKVDAPIDGLSDFSDQGAARRAVGELGVLVDQQRVSDKREQVLLQLLVSFILIGGVLVLVGRLLRLRLIEPIQHIDGAMHALSERNYDSNVKVEGDDELARLAVEVNRTIRTVATYTRELERHRSDADRTLQDADEANLAREALIRTLTEELEEPLNRLHSQLTAIAIANQDAALKTQIRQVLGLLQEAQTNFSDLIELASSVPVARRAPNRDLADVLADIREEIRLLSQTESVPINFAVTQTRFPITDDGSPTGIYVDLDSVRLRKALAYLIRAMARRCKQPGVHVSIEMIRKSPEQLHVSVHLRGFYDPLSDGESLRLVDGLSHYAAAPPLPLGWSERETRIVLYLFRTLGITPLFATSNDGSVSVLLDATCTYSVEHSGTNARAEALASSNSVSAALVSEDLSLARLTTRADLSDYEVTVISFARAADDLTSLRSKSALLIDVSDIAAALRLLEQLRAEGPAPRLIAVCPPGQVSEALGNRLFELGFTALVQKPLQYSRVVQIIRTALADPLSSIHRNSRPLS